MNNYNNNYWGAPNPYNYGYAKPKLPDPTNPLSKDEMALLRQKAPQFSLNVSQVDSLKAICTHRDQNGETLIQNPDGSVTCSICGTTFTPVNADQQTIEQIFKSVVDTLETMKIMYMDIPNDVTKGYFQMIPYLEKGPQLYKIANDHYSRYNNPSVMARDYNNGGNAFALYSALMNPAMAMGAGNPAMQMQYGQQQYAGQPGAMQPNMNTPVPDVTMGMPNGANPFDSSSPAMDNAKTVTDNKQYTL